MSRATIVRLGASSSDPSNGLLLPAVRKDPDRQRCEAGQMTNAILRRKPALVNRMYSWRGSGKKCRARWTSTLKSPIRIWSQGRGSHGRNGKKTGSRVATSDDTTKKALRREMDMATALTAPIGPADPNDRSDPGATARVETTAHPTTTTATTDAATPAGARATASRNTSRAHASSLPPHHQHRHRPKCANGIFASSPPASTQLYPSTGTHADTNTNAMLFFATQRHADDNMRTGSLGELIQLSDPIQDLVEPLSVDLHFRLPLEHALCLCVA